jgi:hypothetical protein
MGQLQEIEGQGDRRERKRKVKGMEGKEKGSGKAGTRIKKRDREGGTEKGGQPSAFEKFLINIHLTFFGDPNDLMRSLVFQV